MAGTHELDASDAFDLFIRPESMIINPKDTSASFNILDGEVKAILFDGGNSRLLVTPEGTTDELVVALPQTKQFDDIRVKDAIRIGWDASKSVCFKRAEWKIYDEE